MKRKESRSPHGERGLKSMLHYLCGQRLQSLPPRGAWIEISSERFAQRCNQRRSPHGERGLK